VFLSGTVSRRAAVEVEQTFVMEQVFIESAHVCIKTFVNLPATNLARQLQIF
jgi:hypothetical protein